MGFEEGEDLIIAVSWIQIIIDIIDPRKLSSSAISPVSKIAFVVSRLRPKSRSVFLTKSITTIQNLNR